MSFYWSPAIESWPVATTMFVVLFCSVWKLGMANPKTHHERPWHQFDQADVREPPRPLHNIQSQKPKPITSPAPLSIVTLSASGLYGISKPKGALDSKVAVASIQPSQRPAASGQQLPRPAHNMQSQEPKPSTNSAPLSIIALSAMELSIMANSMAALESKTATEGAVIHRQPRIGGFSSRNCFPAIMQWTHSSWYDYCCVLMW